MNGRSGSFAWLFVVTGVSVAVAADAPIPDVIEFNRDVRPILSENCYACHGPDANKREAELRLDTEAGLFGKTAKKQPATPGRLDQSELFLRITSSAPEQIMPPVDSGKKLSPREFAILKKWIEQGAKWQGHWAFIKPVRPGIPSVHEAGFTRNEIDRFILARQEAAGLKHAPEADRITLIRRLSFDLTGLPPAPEQVDQFVNDSRADAYEKLVEQILDSPHYGERMALYWLDLVRFADTAGYHSDNPRDIVPYRDYVIQAFNSNLPFNQFTVEQLAGDLLPTPTIQQKVASGYNRLLQTTEEGGAQAKEYTAKYAADRVRNVSSVWLGTTTGCAECHDHKFDPITQRDFYSLAAFFADIQEAAVGRREPGMPVPSAKDEQELARIDGEIASARKQLDDAVAALIGSRPSWSEELSADGQWMMLEPKEVKVLGESHLHKQGDGSYKSSGKVAAKETYLLTLQCDEKLTGLRIETLPDDELPSKGPGLAPNGNFVLTEFKVTRQGENEKTLPVKVVRGVADHSQNGHDLATAFDGKDNTGWAVLPLIGQAHEAIFELAEPVSGSFTIALEFKSQYPQHGIGRLRLSGSTVDKPASRWVPSALRTVLAKKGEEQNDADRVQITEYLRSQSLRFQTQRDVIQKWANDRDAYSRTIPASLISNSGSPRMVRMLPRGNWLDDSGESVLPAIPAYFGRLETGDRRATRLDLANWLVSNDNPLPSRIFVNRIWKLLLGTGISKSLEDAGAQGEWPTHPELLDWLAVEFRESGWNVKHLVRLIVTSGTYRQSSVQTKEARSVDPFNRLLSAQNRVRLDAEFIRDNALWISGLLSARIGGESDKPYQPDGYWEFLNFPKRTWEFDKGERQYRRGMYTWWQRSFLHPSLLAFDAPSREECTADRPRSNTPQQALTLLNDPTYVEAARSFAARILKEGGATDDARIVWAVRRAVSRKPTPEEIGLLQQFLVRQRVEFQQSAGSADQLVRTGEAPVPDTVEKIEVAAWTNVARVLLNLHETITRL